MKVGTKETLMLLIFASVGIVVGWRLGNYIAYDPNCLADKINYYVNCDNQLLAIGIGYVIYAIIYLVGIKLTRMTYPSIKPIHGDVKQE